DRDNPTLSLRELAARTGWNRGTAYRFASTLVELGYLERDPATKRYRPGLKVLELGFTCLSSLGLADRTQPALEELFSETGGPVHMAVLDGSDIVYVARRADRSLTQIQLYAGARLPAYCTSMGKVLLAYRPWDEVKALMRDVRMQPHTPTTATTIERLGADLEEIRRAGYGVTDQELELGVRSVAAPIRDASGAVVAAVNVSTLTARVSLDQMLSELRPKVLGAAARMSAALGYAPREVLGV
ncbi:MAG TPA: IclR family transcriptional regulator, partial [Gaiellaceae bacterium]|nr:IclR family transcriptional regulator [Gaiellaceae bacterium]